MVGAPAPVPKRVFGRYKLDSGGYKRTSVTNGRETINGTKVAGHINRDKEEVRFIRVKCPYIAVQESFVNRNLCSKQMVATPLV